ncbi:MAG: hypothetical protein MUO72_04015 [Bacteroidales bacterium]|nr:hypothetical protein [Bacteroidales bacterium]
MPARNEGGEEEVMGRGETSSEVYKDKGFVYCTLYFFCENKIITVSQILQPDAYIIWRIMDDREYDEIMSTRLWWEVDKKNDLLEFNF